MDERSTDSSSTKSATGHSDSPTNSIRTSSRSSSTLVEDPSIVSQETAIVTEASVARQYNAAAKVVDVVGEKSDLSGNERSTRPVSSSTISDIIAAYGDADTTGASNRSRSTPQHTPAPSKTIRLRKPDRDAVAERPSYESSKKSNYQKQVETARGNLESKRVPPWLAKAVAHVQTRAKYGVVTEQAASAEIQKRTAEADKLEDIVQWRAGVKNNPGMELSKKDDGTLRLVHKSTSRLAPTPGTIKRLSAREVSSRQDSSSLRSMPSSAESRDVGSRSTTQSNQLTSREQVDNIVRKAFGHDANDAAIVNAIRDNKNKRSVEPAAKEENARPTYDRRPHSHGRG
jgi:hypothetical protein